MKENNLGIVVFFALCFFSLQLNTNEVKQVRGLIVRKAQRKKNENSLHVISLFYFN